MAETNSSSRKKLVPYIDKETFEQYEDDGLINILKFSNLTPDRLGAKLVSFNDTGNGFVASDSSGNIIVMYLRGNKFAIIAKSIYPTCLSFYDHDQGIIFAGLPSKIICGYNIDGKNVFNLKSHKREIRNIYFDAQTQLIFSLDDKECIVWDYSTLRTIRILKAEESSFSSISYFPRQNILVTCMKNSSISLWNLDSFEIIEQIDLKSPNRIITLTHFAEDECIVATGPSSCMIQIQINDPNNHQIWKFSSVQRKVLCSKLISGLLLLTLTDDNFLSFIDLQNNGKILGKKFIKEAKISKFSIDQNGKYILMLATTGDIYLYDCERIIMSINNIANKRLALGIPPEEIFETLELISEKQFDYLNSISNYEEIEQIKEKISTTSTIIRDDEKKVERNLEKSLEGPITTHSSIKKSQNTHQKIENLPNKTLQKKPRDISFYGEKWTKLLELPRNKNSFENLLSQGIHSCFTDISIPGFSPLRQKNFKFLLSSFAHYDRVFAEISWFPDFIMPFFKFFEDDLTFCFELILSLIINWGQYLFTSYPTQPMIYFSTCDKILKFNRSEVLSLNYQKTLQTRYILANSIQTLFSDILNEIHWLQLLDFFIENKDYPIYLVLFIAAYQINFASAIEKYEFEIDTNFFKERKNTIEIDNILNMMIELKRSTPDIVYNLNFSSELPLPSGRYPLFKFGPKQSIEIYSSFRNKILSETYNPTQSKSEIKPSDQLYYSKLLKTNSVVDKDPYFKSIKNDEDYILNKLEVERRDREERMKRLKEIESTIKQYEEEDIKNLEKYQTSSFGQESIRKQSSNRKEDVRNYEKEIYDLEVARKQRLDNIKDQLDYQKSTFSDLCFKISKNSQADRISPQLESKLLEEIQRCRHSLEILNNERILQNQELEESKAKLKNIKQDAARNTFQANILNLRRENVLEIVSLEKEFENLLVEIEEKLKYEYRSTSQRSPMKYQQNYKSEKSNEKLSYQNRSSKKYDDSDSKENDDSLESSKYEEDFAYKNYEPNDHSVDTGNFAKSTSPYKQSVKYGQSISSYQYSETVLDENERNQASRSEHRNSDNKLRYDKSLSAYSIDSSKYKYK